MQKMYGFNRTIAFIALARITPLFLPAWAQLFDLWAKPMKQI